LRLQLLGFVSKPVKSVILLFPIRGELEVLVQQEEAEFKEKGQVPVDPTVFWIKQTVRPARLVYLKLINEMLYCEVRSATHAARSACSTRWQT
jgi:hypothetical protein